MSGGPLVSTGWLAEHLADPGLVLVEVDEQPLMYDVGHIPGARNVQWRRDLQDQRTRDIPDAAAMRALWHRLGIVEGSTVVLYGDKNNWHACFAYWLFALYGLRGLALLDGGRQLWLSEGRPTTTAVPPDPAASASAAGSAPASGFESASAAGPPEPRVDATSRATWRDVLDAADSTVLLDVRTRAEFTGELLTEPGYAGEVAQRPGHIPGARHAPWNRATNPDGTFLALDALRDLYARHDVAPGRPVITYCRIGERSAHTWFVLHELLGLPDVRNYDGSWTEWGSMIGMPVALGPQRP